MAKKKKSEVEATFPESRRKRGKKRSHVVSWVRHRCNNALHYVGITNFGKLIFVNHTRKELERFITINEFGNENCKCADVLISWRKAREVELPGEIARWRTFWQPTDSRRAALSRFKKLRKCYLPQTEKLDDLLRHAVPGLNPGEMSISMAPAQGLLLETAFRWLLEKCHLPAHLLKVHVLDRSRKKITVSAKVKGSSRNIFNNTRFAVSNFIRENARDLEFIIGTQQSRQRGSAHYLEWSLGSSMYSISGEEVKNYPVLFLAEKFLLVGLNQMISVSDNSGAYNRWLEARKREELANAAKKLTNKLNKKEERQEDRSCTKSALVTMDMGLRSTNYDTSRGSIPLGFNGNLILTFDSLTELQLRQLMSFLEEKSGLFNKLVNSANKEFDHTMRRLLKEDEFYAEREKEKS